MTLVGYRDDQLVLTTRKTANGRGDILAGYFKIGEVFRTEYGWMAVVYGLPEMWPLEPDKTVRRQPWDEMTKTLRERWELAKRGFWLWEITRADGFRLVRGNQAIGMIWRPPGEYCFQVDLENAVPNPLEERRDWTPFEAIEDVRA